MASCFPGPQPSATETMSTGCTRWRSAVALRQGSARAGLGLREQDCSLGPRVSRAASGSRRSKSQCAISHPAGPDNSIDGLEAGAARVVVPVELRGPDRSDDATQHTELQHTKAAGQSASSPIPTVALAALAPGHATEACTACTARSAPQRRSARLSAISSFRSGESLMQMAACRRLAPPRPHDHCGRPR